MRGVKGTRSLFDVACKQCSKPFTTRFRKQRYCSVECGFSANRYDLEKSVAAFWAKIDKRGPDECWLFTGALNTTGRAMVTWEGKKNIVATRKVWELTRGPIPEGQYVLHRCDVRHCCNPAHLFLGTYKDNAIDKAAKGRAPQTYKTLTAQDAIQIRAEYRLENRRSNAVELAKRYGVTRDSISAVIARRTWRNV